MSHYHLEIVMPPISADLIEDRVQKILRPFSENISEDDEDRSSYQFWDWFVIGGRFSGSKIMGKIDETKVNEFWDWAKDVKLTVSSLQMGKQEISPKSQEAMVDAEFQKRFPELGKIPCPLFKHFEESYRNGCAPFDICKLSEVPQELRVERVIVADDEGEPITMVQKDFWNGVNHIDTTFDGNFKSAIEGHVITIKNYAEAYRIKNTPSSEWLVVTVDYHC